ncbi:hypothetical protein NDU88_005202 [Pleurodeles waltl]|uniref:Uncharacterized protein n=1 Tax=Pleurodeles waltl TaxID=8319 RepID=A0AAV7TTC9_PLEWA|nr:hypothetical protein NDU88_005202 [Pleurodeles waltl]
MRRSSSTSSLTVQLGDAPAGANPRHPRCETAPKLVGSRRVSRQHRRRATVHLSRNPDVQLGRRQDE